MTSESLKVFVKRVLWTLARSLVQSPCAGKTIARVSFSTVYSMTRLLL